MVKNKKFVCIIISICFLINTFIIFPSYADQENSDQNSTTTSDEKKPLPKPEDEDIFSYNKKIPLKQDHQELLWNYCKKRDLDFIDMLSLIYTESNFNEKCSSGIYKGYFQISKKNCANLAKCLNTSNNPLDGLININWGTSIYSGILKDKRVKNLKGKEKRDVALSIYQRGTGGYDKYGINSRFLKSFYKKRDIVCTYFE